MTVHLPDFVGVYGTDATIVIEQLARWHGYHPITVDREHELMDVWISAFIDAAADLQRAGDSVVVELVNMHECDRVREIGGKVVWLSPHEHNAASAAEMYVDVFVWKQPTVAALMADVVEGLKGA